MADYNIYIHAIGGGSTNEFNPTVPWSVKEQNGADGGTSNVSAWGSGNVGLGAIPALANGITNPDSIVALGIGALKKALPIIAVAMAAISVTDKVASMCLDFSSIQSGDYSGLISYQNFKAGVNSFLRPFSTTLNRYREELTNNIDNNRKALQRALLGDSVINQYTRGV